ncbi:MAG: Linear gramicidin synthase subunit D [Chloroflexi bacterium ADurb.Bin180]|nr:MAG: Linear gramicidin synthase subunit D [Chloroflexi bacterium ADurb.Bin180]HNR97396.1 phosphopantetheine-binding protein [Anaerolineae bacterium]HNT06016.1 phosphopantetheine-binding protein [Anaerolineae bacterium]HOU24276.1 phosphopantetheine-binding protein [Anaerolineae bacterium]HQJ51872.1 phosphopantetheine-binding protein [Anaerolineae bacterium]
MTTQSPSADATLPAAPRSAVEAEIAAMAAEVLGLPTVGVEDNLLDLGAASLELGQIIVRVRQRYGVEVRMVPFFDTPTVAYLATLAEQATTRTS